MNAVKVLEPGAMFCLLPQRDAGKNVGQELYSFLGLPGIQKISWRRELCSL